MPTQWLKFEGRMQTTQQIRQIKAKREELEKLDSITGLNPEQQKALKGLNINSRTELVEAILDPAIEDALGESYAFVAGQVAPEKFIEEEEDEERGAKLVEEEDKDKNDNTSGNGSPESNPKN